MLIPLKKKKVLILWLLFGAIKIALMLTLSQTPINGCLKS